MSLQFHTSVKPCFSKGCPFLGEPKRSHSAPPNCPAPAPRPHNLSEARIHKPIPRLITHLLPTGLLSESRVSVPRPREPEGAGQRLDFPTTLSGTRLFLSCWLSVFFCGLNVGQTDGNGGSSSGTCPLSALER